VQQKAHDQKQGRPRRIEKRRDPGAGEGVAKVIEGPRRIPAAAPPGADEAGLQRVRRKSPLQPQRRAGEQPSAGEVQIPHRQEGKR
jgi:hypothetical protein